MKLIIVLLLFVKFVICTIDVNNDGTINKEEIIQSDLFKKYDINNDNELSNSEVFGDNNENNDMIDMIELEHHWKSPAHKELARVEMKVLGLGLALALSNVSNPQLQMKQFRADLNAAFDRRASVIYARSNSHPLLS